MARRHVRRAALVSATRIGHAPSMSYVFKYAGRFPGGQLLVSGNHGKPPAAPFKIKVHEHTYTVTSIATDATQAATPNVYRLQLQGINSEVDVNSLQLSDKEEIPVLLS